MKKLTKDDLAKNLTFTDFPLDEIILWVVDSFILLPSEY